MEDRRDDAVLVAIYLFRSRSGFAVVRSTPELPDRDAILVAHFDDVEEAPGGEPAAVVVPQLTTVRAPALKA